MKTSNSPITVQLPHHRKSTCSIFGSLTALAAGLALLGGQLIATAQTENFDSGAAIFSAGPNQWIEANVLAPIGGFVNNSFVANGSGSALRLQRGSADMTPLGAPQAYGTGRGWIYRTNDYTDFYVAMDLVNWNDATNQAMVLLARGTGFNDTPLAPFLPGLGAVNGYVLNYDNRQDGQNPGDRNGGELQINNITGEGPSTLAAAEVTLTPGHTYRMVFKGVGTTLTGQVYDVEDLTKPIATIVGEDTDYSSGKSGIVTFCREDIIHPNRTDETVDNYYAAASDPNTDIAPAIRHPIAGTPQVVTRTPANRFTNFHPAASGISFTARTFTAGQINASATKLYLNGVDVSASLAPLPANGSTVSFTTAAATLAANTIYSARIELEDTTGTLKSTNTFWFDTFTDAYMASLKTVEVEDYNYSNGVYQLDPIAVSGKDAGGSPVNGSGVGYFDLTGTAGVDYFKPGGHFDLPLAEYRTADRVQITQGSLLYSGSIDEAGDIQDSITALSMPYRIHDTQRAKYASTNVLEYQVRLTSPGDWMNYTRNFAPTNYNVYLRCGSFGDTTVYLDQVTSDPTTTNQTTARLGAFNVGNHIMRLNYKYEQLMSGSHPAVISLSGLKTLRLTLGGTVSKDNRLIVMDYLVFVPTSNGPTIFDNFDDGNDSADAVWDRYDPIGGVAPPVAASYTFPSGHYRILSPAQTPVGCAAGPARAGSFLANAVYNDFYVSADLIDFDDTVRQAFGIAARINTPGLQSTGGYLFSWEPGSGSLPGVSNGDLDISRLVDEAPIGQIETASSGLHLTKGKSYRFVFMGSGTNFEGQVYELPDTTNPLIRLPANDPDNLYPSGQVGLISASQGSCDVPGDATWDNFLVTTAEPRLAVSVSGGTATLTWPQIPFALQSTPSLSSPVWTTITTGITPVGNQMVYTVPATGTAFYRLVYP